MVLEQRIWHYRVSLVKKKRMILNFTPKTQLQNMTSRPIWGHRSNQVKAVIFCIIRFGGTAQEKHFGTRSIRVSPLVQKLWAEESLSHRFIMGWVENWPDLKSLQLKIRNMHCVRINSNISSSKFEYIRTKIVQTARSSSLKPVPVCTSDFDLTWWLALFT